MLLVSFKQIELGLFLHLDAEVVKLLDRRITGKEILRAGAERNDLEIVKAETDAGNRQEIVNHIRAVFCITDRILRNPCGRVPQCQVIAGIEHAAERIAASGDAQRRGSFFGSGAEHLRPVKMFCEKCLGDFGAEVTKVDAERIAAVRPDIFERVHHVRFTLHDGDRAFIDVVRAVLVRIGLYQRFSSVHGKRSRETVSGYRYNTDFDCGNIGCHMISFRFCAAEPA